jgi:hypothetical protein
MSRCVKPVLALLAVLAASLAFAAPPAGLSWEVHGTGSGSASLFVVASSGPAMPQHVGNATYFLNLSSPGGSTVNGAGGLCVFITGSGSVRAADGSTISFATVGTLCNEAGSNGEIGDSALHYNGTYRINGANGRFTGVAGGGNLAATFNSTHFIKLDGTITGI